MDVRLGPVLFLGVADGMAQDRIMDTCISIADRVDLLILGGSAGACACALAARRAGLRVLIAAPLSGLGDDIAAYLRLLPGAAINDPLAAALFPAGRCPSPLHAKTTCETAVIEAGIRVILGALPCGVVRDAAGKVCGAIVAHRGGRSAVVARAVVDAGHSAPFTRQAGLAFDAWDGGTLTVETAILAQVGELIPGTESATPLNGAGSGLTLSVRRDEIALPQWTPTALHALQAQAQLRAFHPRSVAMSDWSWWLPPVGIRGGNRASAWSGAETFALDALATVEPRLWVLGPAADLERAVAGKIAAPAALSAVGDRLGDHLARALLPAPTPASAALPGSTSGVHLSGDRGGFRPTNTGLETLPLDDAQLPLLGEAEVLVVGGGTGGAAVGIAAAREGAATLIIERLHRLGGVGTLGRISRYWYGNRSGFTAELNQRVQTSYGEPRYPKEQGAFWVLEHKQDAWLRLLDEVNGRCWFGCQAVAAGVVDGRITGALVAGVHGAGLVRCRAAVDATGSADLAAAAGAPCRVITAEHIAVQGTGLSPVDPRVDYQNSDHDFSDDNDAVDATRILTRSRRKFPQAWDTAPIIDSRERRQIRGQYELTPIDICCDRRFPDAVVRASSNFDSHGFTIHPVFMVHVMDKKPMHAWVPYRCLLPQGIDGLLVTGLGMSAHRDVLPVVRMQADVQNAGFSAGVAVALAVKIGVGTQALPVRTLQERLVALGHLPAEVTTLSDSFPLPVAQVEALIATRFSELISVAAAFAFPDAALPALRQALTDPDRRERAALVLGMQGHAAAAPVLHDLLVGNAWDKGWRFTGMHQFGATISPIDARLIAYAHCSAADGIDLVTRWAKALPDDAALSHVRAIALVCTSLVARHLAVGAQAQAILSALLNRPGMTGYAQADLDRFLQSADPDSICTIERERCLREIHLAVALWRCGGRELARRWLESYRDDLHGHYARHATAVLAEAGV